MWVVVVDVGSHLAPRVFVIAIELAYIREVVLKLYEANGIREVLA